MKITKVHNNRSQPKTMVAAPEITISKGFGIYTSRTLKIRGKAHNTPHSWEVILNEEEIEVLRRVLQSRNSYEYETTKNNQTPSTTTISAESKDV